MTVVLSWKVDENQPLFPMCIGLGRLDPNNEPTGVVTVPLMNYFLFLTLIISYFLLLNALFY